MTTKFQTLRCCRTLLTIDVHLCAQLGCYYRPQRSYGQGYVFTRVGDSVHRGGLPQCILGYHPCPPWSRPPRSRPPWEQTPHPPGADTHTPRGADSSIRSMSGQYASYWNASLLTVCICPRARWGKSKPF